MGRRIRGTAEGQATTGASRSDQLCADHGASVRAVQFIARQPDGPDRNSLCGFRRDPGMYVSDLDFSISAAIGFVSLFGVSVMSGILIINRYNHNARARRRPCVPMFGFSRQGRGEPTILDVPAQSLRAREAEWELGTLAIGKTGVRNGFRGSGQFAESALDTLYVARNRGRIYILAFAAMAFVAFVSAMEGWGCWSENRKLEKSFCCPRCCPE
jgi:hypothetical protein